MEKLKPEWSISDNDELLILDLTNELNFINNLRYWQVSTNLFKAVHLSCLDTNYQLSFLEVLKLLTQILNVYQWASPECFYEVVGLVWCLSTIQKKYILHKQSPDKAPLITEAPLDLLEGLAATHEHLTYREHF